MADTGFNWLTLTHFQVAAADVDSTAVADTAAITCDAVDLDGYAACEVSVTVVEDNTGAVNGDAYVSILRSDLDPDSEGYQVGPTTGPVYTDAVWSVAIDAVPSATRKVTFSISPAQVSKFKLHVLNDAGQTLDVTANYKLATIPAAS